MGKAISSISPKDHHNAFSKQVPLGGLGGSQFTLPKDHSGKPQAPYSPNISPNKANTAADLRNEIEQTEKEFLQVLMQSFKNQGIDPDSTSKASDVAQTRAAIASATGSLKAAVAATDLKEMFEGNDILRNKSFHGQKVSWDDSKRDFMGKPVTFNYTVKYPDGRLPETASVSAILSVYDANKKEVFRTSKNVDINNGQNAYVWNGQDAEGNELEKGEYSVEVKLHYTDENGNRVRVPVETSLSGIVDAVESGGKLRVNGQLVDASAVTRMEKPLDTAEKTYIPADNMHYLGKSAHVKCDRFSVINASQPAELVCIAPEEISEIIVYVYDEASGKNVATIKRNVNFTEGYNKFSYDLIVNAEDKSKLPVGNYRYQIMGKTVDSDEMVALANEMDITITAIDADCVFDGDKQFSLDDIVRFNSASSSVSNNPVAEGSQYMGKDVTYDNNMFSLPETGYAEEYIAIPKPPAGSTLGDAELLVYGPDNKLIHKETYKAATLYHAEAEDVPTTIDALELESQGVMEDLITDYKKLHDEKKPSGETIKASLAVEFRAGRIFKEGYDDLDDMKKATQKLRNTGRVAVVWDGHDQEHKKCPSGSYRFEFKTTNVHNGQSVQCPPHLEITSRIVGFDTVSGKVQLRAQNGRVIDPSRVKRISF